MVSWWGDVPAPSPESQAIFPEPEVVSPEPPSEPQVSSPGPEATMTDGESQTDPEPGPEAKVEAAVQTDADTPAEPPSDPLPATETSSGVEFQQGPPQQPSLEVELPSGHTDARIVRLAGEVRRNLQSARGHSHFRYGGFPLRRPKRMTGNFLSFGNLARNPGVSPPSCGHPACWGPNLPPGWAFITKPAGAISRFPAL